MSVNSGPEAWLLNDGRAGHWRQVQALAHFLRLRKSVVPVNLKPPWRWFAPRKFPLGLAAHRGLLAGDTKPPDVIISCGRRSALAARWLQTHFGGLPQTLQILDCGLSPGCFSWVIAPQHDGLDGENVIQTIGSLNPVDELWLRDATIRDQSVPAPTNGSLVLLGGPSRNFDFSHEWFRSTLSNLHRWSDGCELTVVESPRTPGWVADAIEAQFDGRTLHRVPWLKDQPEDCEMRYRAALATAERIFVTADSVNLVSEACASGKTVCLLGLDQAQGKMTRFCRYLFEAGYVLQEMPPWPGSAGEPVTRCLRETEAVARLLIKSGALEPGLAG